MQVRNDRQHARYFFESIQEAERWIDETPRTWRSNESADAQTNAAWDLGATLIDARTMARDGWLEGAAKVKGALKSLPMRTPAPETRYDIVGFRPNVGRYCAGLPDNMVRKKTNAESGSGRVVTLVVPINASAGTDAKAMSNFGIAVMHHVRQLELDKVRVEVIVCATVSLSDGTRLCTAVRVKRSDQHMNLNVLAFAIGHPAMFRRIMFAIRERTETKYDSSYGFSKHTEARDIVNAKPGTVIINGMREADSVACTPEAALKYVEAQITNALAGGAKGPKAA